MKRIGFALIGGLMLTMSVTSCSKSYNCHCVYKTDGTVSHEDDTMISEGKKEKTAAACDDMDNTYETTLNGNTTVSTTECELED